MSDKSEPVASDAASHAAPKHTPGPWRVGGLNGNVVYGDEPEIAKGMVVAHCNHTGEIPPGVDTANAHLIAAAPELYEALKALVVGADNATIVAFDDPMVATAKRLVEAGRAALTKAEGK